jgi:hypothetical protein
VPEGASVCCLESDQWGLRYGQKLHRVVDKIKEVIEE